MNRLWSMVLLASVAGCGGGSTLEVADLVPVSGKITLDGKPLPSAQVFLLPKGTTRGQGAFASTDESGGFAMKCNNGEDGCPKGEYSIQISKLMTPDGQPIPEGQTAADVGAIDIIPPRYKDPDAPQNALNVDGPKTDLVFALKTR
uniref:Carboxypeptidase regulatory-like domain-containing protein n=1 Tax=Schlesneria paludicola TaxID=360056 RepID=A0A7C2JY55_9PLAN